MCKTIPEEVWTCGPSARVLDVSQNSLLEVPAAVGCLSSMQKLLLNGNHLLDKSIGWEGLTSLKLLTVLSLNQNKQFCAVGLKLLLFLLLDSLTTLPSAVGAFTCLKQLHIANNKLTCIPTEIGCLTELQVLKAQNNRKIDKIRGERGDNQGEGKGRRGILWAGKVGQHKGEADRGNEQTHERISEEERGKELVDLSCNLLAELPQTLGNLKSLKALYLGNNGLKSLPNTLFKMCLQLSILDLHGTEITLDLLRQFEGWESFDERRRLKHQKQLDFRVTGSSEFDEGADRNCAQGIGANDKRVGHRKRKKENGKASCGNGQRERQSPGYKSEAFERFKEYRLAVANQTGRNIRALRSDRDREYLRGEFVDYLRVRSVQGSSAYVKGLVGDKLDSRSSLYMLIGYPKETAGRRDGILFKESSEVSHETSKTASMPIVPTDSVPVLRTSARVAQPPKRHGLDGIKPGLNPSLKPVGCKWDYTHNLGVDREVTTFKARLVAIGDASYIIGIKIYRDRSRRMLGMIQFSYIEKVLKRFKIENSKRGFLALRHEIKLPVSKTNEELKRMSNIPYASIVGSIQYIVQCTGPDVAFAFSATTTDSIIKFEYIAASEAAKEAIWMKNYIQELGVVPSIAEPVVIFWNNSRAITQAKESRSHHQSKHILKRYHLLGEMVSKGDVLDGSSQLSGKT
ncbi:LRR repeats and ubiquitin-like domain-containing protein [Sesamum angolense]|uniref:LRR repeats and ubiquitin-like domain-containing protein n=1 Tax=Sesamum angolense TaxID=2727404 RepID=A0AAE1T4V2_9LAMI|nr:LRR repeats and ubiquitin-like domain-containing protein [Sesamum angolense]